MWYGDDVMFCVMFGVCDGFVEKIVVIVEIRYKLD